MNPATASSVSATHALVAPRAPVTDGTLRNERMTAYPQEIWWCFAVFIALVALFQFISWATNKLSLRALTSKKARRTSVEAGGTAPGRTSRSSWRNLPTALVNAYRVVAFRWTINVGRSHTLNVAEVFITCAYIAALFTWAFINSTTLEGQPVDVSYWAHRAGTLGASQLPLITILGTRNNLLSYVTGVSYDKLNYLHRMTSRVMYVLMWVHGGGEIYRFPATGDKGWYVRLGVTMMVGFTALMVVSIRPIRARAYEAFNVVHFLTVFLVLVGGYFHAWQWEYSYLIWPAFIFWALDRVMRVARMVYYNHLYFGLSKNANQLDASIELLSPHLVRLLLHRPPHFKWTPGQTAFLTMPSVSDFALEAHPFTIVSVDSRYQLGDGNESATATEVEKASGSSDGHAVAPYWKELVFFVNVREGFTKRLAAIAEKGEKVKVLLDGPYGFSPNLDNDDTVVLVAGGSGVSYTLSTLLGVLSHAQHNKSRCRKIVFIWSIRNASHIEWVSKAFAAALERAPAELDISIRIFVTGHSEQNALAGASAQQEDDSIHSSNEKSVHDPSQTLALALLRFPAVRVTQGRPDLVALLHDEVEASTGRLSVTVCGSQGIAQACRKALRVPMAIALQGGPSVVLHVESFGYA